MLIQTGNVTYTIRTTDHRLYVDGRPTMSICDHRSGEVLIDEAVSPEQLNEILLSVYHGIAAHHESVAASGRKPVETPTILLNR